MQKRLVAEMTCGVRLVKLDSDGIMTTPPPMPQRLLRTPATVPVGKATATGIGVWLERWRCLIIFVGALGGRERRHMLALDIILTIRATTSS